MRLGESKNIKPHVGTRTETGTEQAASSEITASSGTKQAASDSTENKSQLDEGSDLTYGRFAPTDPKEKYDDYETLKNIKTITSKIQQLSFSTKKDKDSEYQQELSDLIKIIEDSNDASFIKDNPTIENRKIEINDLLTLIKVRYPNLKEISKKNYDEYIKLREEELKKRQSDREEEYKTPNEKLNEYLKNIKDHTYGDPIIPGAILGLTTINVVGDILNGDTSRIEEFSTWVGGIPGIGGILDSGIDLLNLPIMIVSQLFHSIHVLISPTGIASFVVLKLVLFGIPKLINFINGDGFKDPPSAEDILNEYVNQLQNINETNVDENKYFASMLVTMTYLTNLTNETINVNELKNYSNNVKKIFSILKEKDQDQIIEIILDYYVISMSMINTSNGDINTQKKRILKNTALFYFLLSKDPNMPFNHIFKNEEIKIKLVNKFDEYILDLTIKTFSLMSGVTTQSDKQMIKDIVIINSKSESDNSIKDKMLMKYTPEQKAKEITVKIIENIEKNLNYGSSKVIGLFKFYFNKIETREKLLKGFFDQFHEKIISKKLISKIKPIFITKIIDILDKQAILAKQEKEENEKMNSTLDIYNIQNTLIEKLDKKDLYNENLENSDPQLLEEIYDYFDLIFKTFINHHDIKNKNNNSVELGWTFTNTDEPFTEAIREFKIFLTDTDLNNSAINNSLIKMLNYNNNIQIIKKNFLEKLLKYMVLFIYKLNLSNSHNKEFKYYRIPQIFQKNIQNSQENYNIFNSVTINSVKELTDNKKYVHDKHITLIHNKLTFLSKSNEQNNNYKYNESDNNTFTPLCSLNKKELKTHIDGENNLIEKLIIRNNHYTDEGIGKNVFVVDNENKILKFLNSFTIIRFEIKPDIEKDKDYMLNLDSSIIGFEKLIKHVKFINEDVIKKAIKDSKKNYVDIMFPNEYFQDEVNRKNNDKSYHINIKNTTYLNYDDENASSKNFNSIRKYTLKVSDEDGFTDLKKFKHVLTPFHYFEFDNNDDNKKYYLQPKILDEVALNEYFKQIYLEGAKEVKFQQDMLYTLGMGALTASMIALTGGVGLAAIATSAAATGVASFGMQVASKVNPNLISSKNANRAMTGMIGSTLGMAFADETLIQQYEEFFGDKLEDFNNAFEDILDGDGKSNLLDSGDSKEEILNKLGQTSNDWPIEHDQFLKYSEDDQRIILRQILQDTPSQKLPKAYLQELTVEDGPLLKSEHITGLQLRPDQFFKTGTNTIGMDPAILSKMNIEEFINIPEDYQEYFIRNCFETTPGLLTEEHIDLINAKWGNGQGSRIGFLKPDILPGDIEKKLGNDSGQISYELFNKLNNDYQRFAFGKDDFYPPTPDPNKKMYDTIGDTIGQAMVISPDIYRESGAPLPLSGEEKKKESTNQKGGRNTNFSGFMTQRGAEEKYNKFASTVYTIDIDKGKQTNVRVLGSEKYFNNAKNITIKKTDNTIIKLEDFLKITGCNTSSDIEKKSFYKIITDINNGGYWKDYILPCIHKDIDANILEELFKNPSDEYNGSNSNTQGKDFINTYIQKNTEKNIVEKDYSEYFTQLYNSTKFNNVNDYILVFSNSHNKTNCDYENGNKKIYNNNTDIKRDQITISDISKNPLILLNGENEKLPEICKKLINYLRNVSVSMKEKGEILPGIIILKNLKKIKDLITIEKQEPEEIKKLFKKEQGELKTSTGLDIIKSLAVSTVTAGTISTTLNNLMGAATELLPIVSTVSRTGVSIVSNIRSNLDPEQKKKIESEYATLDTLYNKVNRFINTDLEHIRATPATLLDWGKDNTSEIMGGKKRKKPKTVRKYRYIKNKTGKKRKKSEKIKIIKKNKNKMKISQAIIKHL